MRNEEFRAEAKLGALSSAVTLGSFVTVNHVEEAARALEDIAASLKRISEIVDQLGGQVEERSAREDIGNVIAEVEQLMRVNAELLGRTSRAASALRDHTQHLVNVVARGAAHSKRSGTHRQRVG